MAGEWTVYGDSGPLPFRFPAKKRRIAPKPRPLALYYRVRGLVNRVMARLSGMRHIKEEFFVFFPNAGAVPAFFI
jgi:hypothetical protein